MLVEFEKLFLAQKKEKTKKKKEKKKKETVKMGTEIIKVQQRGFCCL